uniref:Chondroitin sulfate proteoglycan 4-like n=1 Tax=Echeneis naucrates TaxID=173247 RepID=A0A665TYT0_ECHNA
RHNVPLENASVQTLLHVRFRTSSQTGLLFLAAGNRDFLVVELISGRLQVRLDLGSGERSLRSEKGIHLSDLGWHSLELTHDRHDVNMTVDRNSHTSLRMPGPDLELRVEDGLFVGGAAGLDRLYLVNISTGFRGCVDEIVFNEHNLLSSLRPYSGYKSVHEVSLGCSPQFSATEEDPVSFFSSKAFITLPPWEVPQEGVFECELHPSAREEDGIILYSSGNQGEFVAIEIIDGYLVATIGNGEGNKIELRSLTHVHSNYTWYPIQLRLLPHSIQLKVDKELIKADLSLELQVIQFKGPLFLGGLNKEALGEARRAGLYSASSGGGGSFKGCLGKIRVNTQRTGLHHAAITKDITVGCKMGQAPMRVTTSSPTAPSEVHVVTAQPISDNKNPNFLTLRTLEVNLDFRKLGIHPSQLMFRIAEQPVHGQLKLDLRPDPTFSMLDLWQGRVMYVHSGSEDERDFFMFSAFSSNKKELPVFLKSNRLHRFDISITPVNDAPVLSLPEGNLFTMLEKSKRQVDTVKWLLGVNIYVHFIIRNMEILWFHLSSRAINLFSLHDLEEGKISFVHTGVSTSRLPLRVSDGQKASHVTVTLQHKLVNNTGLEVNQGEATIITTSHLAVQVNVADQAVEIRYDLTESPRYGELQRLHSSGEWKLTTSFSQKLLEKERIRYLSTYHGLQTQSNVTDEFKCKISIGSLSTEEAIFPIMVRWIHFKVTRSKMELNGVQSAVVTPEHLHVVSKGIRLNESDLFFRLRTVPKKGQLLLDNKVLQNNSTFSQKNITDGFLKYELLNRLQDDTRDSVRFQVFSTHGISTSYDFRIIIKSESTSFSIVNKGLSVVEGGRRVVTKDILFTHTASNREVQYIITVSPRHGQIRKINLSNSTSINDNIRIFTNQDIMEERIMYVHDDSETKQDSFTFQIMVYKPHKHTSKTEDRNPVEHTFNISVNLVNDQRPVRVVDKVFHVAREGQRLVTLNDLQYRDDDSDFDDSWLVYTRRGIPMGELVLASDRSHKLYEFTQRDLEQKKVLFVHRGVSFGRFVLFVTDGKHYVSTLLEVMAQDPYLQVENNTGLMVQRDGITMLTSANLSVFSNLDIRDPQEVTYEVFQPPKHGVLCFNGGDCDKMKKAGAISIFTQWDLVAGRLEYHHDGSHELREVHLDIGVTIKIYLESHQRPPTVINNRPVVVEEGRNVSISREHLEANSQPAEIVFTVQSPPTLGVLQRFSPFGKQQNYNGEEQHLYQQTASFTQDDLNQGLIVYFQQTTGSTNDSVLLEATNGVTKVGPIRLEIDIIPILLPLQVQHQFLNLGSVHLLTFSQVFHKFQRKEPTLCRIQYNGLFFRLNQKRAALKPKENQTLCQSPSSFVCFQVEHEYISYIHDGSDTQSDNFTIVANQTEIRKHSLPCTVHISVTPVNDETPVVATNRGLKVGGEGMTEISTGDLSAEDSDSPSEALEFIVTPPSNGHLALKSAPSRHILNFTQNHIQSGQLVFVHSGEQSRRFHSFHYPLGPNYSGKVTPSSCCVFAFFTGSVTPISEQELQVVTNDVSDIRRNHSVLFTVSAPPKLGRLVRRMPDNSTQIISAFTQNMVGGSYTVYICTQCNMRWYFLGWSAADYFSFTVSSPPAFLHPHTFSILISYQANEHHDNPQHKTRLLNNAGRVTIDGSKLDASNLLGKVPEPHRKDHHILYRVLSLPRHGVEDHDTPPEELHYLVISKPNNGYLTLGERPEPVTSFTQYDVNHGRLHFIQQVQSDTAQSTGSNYSA